MADCTQYSNAASTTLAMDVFPSDGTIEVTSFADFPTTAPYRIRIEDEIMIVTGGAATTTWSVDRAEEDTAAAFHASGTDVGNFITAGGMVDFINCAFLTDVRSGRPAAGTTGRMFLTQGPGWYFFRDNGSDWDAWAATFTAQEPVRSDFDWVNIDDPSGEFAGDFDEDAGLFISTPAVASAGDSVRLKVQDVTAAAPTTTPFKVRVAFSPFLEPVNNGSCGIVFRESSTAKFIFFRMMYDDASTVSKNELVLSLDKYTDPTTFDSNYKVVSAGIFLSNLVWLQMEDDGVDLKWAFSNDANNYIELFSVTRTDFLAGGPDQIGFAVNTNSTSAGAGMTLISWEKS